MKSISTALGFKAAFASATIITASATSLMAETVLNYSPWLPPSYVLNDTVFFPFFDKIAEVTEGRVRVEVLPKVVGSAPAQMDVVIDGAADIVTIITGYSPGRFDAIQLGEMPRLSGDVAELAPAFYRTYENHIAELDLFKGAHLLTIFATTPTFIVTNKPINKVEDFAGLKLRAPSALAGETISALGAVPVSKPVSEMYELASTGVVDGTFFAYQPILDWKVSDFLTDITLTPGAMGQSVMGMLVNDAKWNALEERDRIAIEAVAGEALAKAAGAAYGAAEKKAHESLLAAGVKITEGSPELNAAIAEKLLPIENAWVERAKAQGLAEPRAVLEGLRSELGTAN